jgi:diguanylate cyclase (GGDEF)-like protein/PAS domain S-box-containing protein
MGSVNKEVILVVDDNRQLGDFIAYRLLPNMGFSGRIAYNGKSALETIHQSPPTLILLDLELPDTTGLDILRSLNSEGITIPTILFTAHGSEQIAAEAFRLGVHDYLVKPVEPDQLEGAITRALSETRLRQETARLTAELKEQVTWLSALSKLGQSVTSTLELDEVLRRIVEAAVQLTQADEGFLAMLDPASGQLYMRAAKNIDESRIKTMRLPVEDNWIGRALRSGKPVRKTTGQGEAPVKVSTGFFVHSLLHMPIYSKGRPLGVLSVDNHAGKRGFTQKDEIFITSLVDYAAVALENASLYEQARHEIAERKRMESALRESEERYALAVRGANDGIWDWNLKTNQIYFSPRWKDMLGYSENEIGNDPQEWFNRVNTQDIEKLKQALSAHIRGQTPHFEIEFRAAHKNGSYQWMQSRGLAVRGPDGTVSRIAGSITDISDRKEAEAKLLHDAFVDSLTQLPNRALFLEHLQNGIERANREPGYMYAVLFLDLDRFKNINDSLGHPAGDKLLIAVANLLKTVLRPGDTVARVGGDEFVILLQGIKDSSLAISVSEEILNKLSRPIYLDHYAVYVATNTSIGVVLSTLGYAKPEDVLRDADIAMYAAKARGRGNYQLFDPVMRERIQRRVALESDLQQAIEQKQLLLFYQPILELQSGKLTGFEALVQWQHPTHGLLGAGEFIPIAQDAGMIVPIDWWVFEEACRQAKIWLSRFTCDPPLKINVNLTSSLISQPDLLKHIAQILQNTSLNAQSLGLEITENTATADLTSTVQIIQQLRGMGFDVQIDNFGIGNSSLLNLRRFPVSTLKIDRALIQRIGEQSVDAHIVHTVIELAHEVGMTATAEGVETQDQLQALREMGCDFGQGFLFSTPIDPKAVQEMLQRLQAGKSSFQWWDDTANSAK